MFHFIGYLFSYNFGENASVVRNYVMTSTRLKSQTSQLFLEQRVVAKISTIRITGPFSMESTSDMNFLTQGK